MSQSEVEGPSSTEAPMESNLPKVMDKPFVPTDLVETLVETEEASETTHLLATSEPPMTTTEVKSVQSADELKMTILGMICVGVGTGFINTGGCLVAVVGGSALEIMLARWVVQTVLAAIWWIFKKPPQNEHFYGDKGSRLNIYSRGVLYFLLCYGWYRGLELVPIGDAEAVIFITPLMIVMVARFYLKEELSAVFPATFLMTVAGIIFVCQPDFIFHGANGAESMNVAGFIFLFLMCFAWTGTSILVRTAQEAHWTQIQITTGLQGAFIWTPLVVLLNHYVFESDLIAGGKWIGFPDARYVGLVCLVAVFGFLGITLNILGYQLGDASKVAWMEYLDLIFAYIFQWAIFNQRPNLWEWIGLACLLSTCVLHLGEELFKYKLAKKREEEEALQICDTNSLVPTEEGFDQTVDIAA